jgi:DNA repair exonuclease SbcCD ATPase subunit
MVLALGAALALVFVLLFGRVFWSMAMLAGARRHAKNVPVQVLDLQADRDRLRAEHALMARKLELRVEDIKTRMAEQMAEVSRNRNRVQSLLHDLERKEETLNNKEREIGALATQLEISQTQLTAAHQTIENLGDEATRHDAEMLRLQESFRKLGTSLREKNTLVGNLSEELRVALAAERPAGMETPAPVDQISVDVEGKLRQHVAKLTSISADMSREADILPFAPLASQGDTSSTPHQRHEALHQKVAETERLSEEMARELKALDVLLASSTIEEPVVEAPAPVKRQGAMANVVSLAQRIRALQQGMGE